MYQLSLNDSSQIDVHHKQHTISYGVDGSQPNPLEATYAALAGCAGVYSRKACVALKISPAGIEINCKPVVRSGNMLIPSRFITEVSFPEHITPVQRQNILQEINRCAVKQLIHDGAGIEFVSKETVSA
ncbi:MAG: hypothetical protein R8K20_10550 [Gallionellaceae bacterium]